MKKKQKTGDNKKDPDHAVINKYIKASFNIVGNIIERFDVKGVWGDGLEFFDNLFYGLDHFDRVCRFPFDDN